MTAGSGHACAILDTGQLRCWGYNGYGQLGQGNMDDSATAPGRPPSRSTSARAAPRSRSPPASLHTCAVLDTGQLRCWGSNGYGQLGQGNTDAIGDTLR